MGEPYGPYPTLDDFAQNFNSPQPSAESPALSSAPPSTKGAKLRRHAACDECRKRKLKCTGEPTGCLRCVKNSIACVYSQQKQMGRPRKRQRTDEGPQSPVADEIQYAYPPPLPSPGVPLLHSQPQIEAPLETPIDPSLSNIDQDLTDFQNVCPGTLAQAIRSQREVHDFGGQSIPLNSNMFEQNGNATNLDYPYASYPTDISLWPDFSTIDKLPVPMTTRYDPDPANDLSFPTPSSISIANNDMSQSYYDPDVDPSALNALPSIPACPCLPNLYLALSTLSTLASFPVSQHTIDTLLSAHKTAHAVIYCPVCPQKYQSGSQNLMLGCTLLNVLADHWHRFRQATPEELKKGFNTGNHNQSNGLPTPPQSFISTKEGQTWRHFANGLIRAYVFGDEPIPKTPNSLQFSSEPPTTKVPQMYTLTFLISALERRQRQWHRLDTPTDEFPDRLACEHRPMYGPSRPKSTSEIAGKNRDHDAVATGSRKGSANTATNGGEHRGDDAEEVNGRAEPETDGGDGRTNGHNESDGHKHDQMLCIMIVQHSKDIVQALDRDHHHHA